MLKKENGFTFIELLVALAIVIPVLFSFIGVTFYMMRAGETSQGIITAMQDAHTVIERIRNVSAQGLNQVVATYPNGGAVGGFNNLNNEAITVAYASTTADPLQVTVTVSWQDRNRAMSRSLTTRVTRRS